MYSWPDYIGGENGFPKTKLWRVAHMFGYCWPLTPAGDRILLRRRVGKTAACRTQMFGYCWPLTPAGDRILYCDGE